KGERASIYRVALELKVSAANVEAGLPSRCSAFDTLEAKAQRGRIEQLRTRAPGFARRLNPLGRVRLELHLMTERKERRSMEHAADRHAPIFRHAGAPARNHDCKGVRHNR